MCDAVDRQPRGAAHEGERRRRRREPAAVDLVVRGVGHDPLDRRQRCADLGRAVGRDDDLAPAERHAVAGPDGSQFVTARALADLDEDRRPEERGRDLGRFGERPDLPRRQPRDRVDDPVGPSARRLAVDRRPRRERDEPRSVRARGSIGSTLAAGRPESISPTSTANPPARQRSPRRMDGLHPSESGRNRPSAASSPLFGPSARATAAASGSEHLPNESADSDGCMHRMGRRRDLEGLFRLS